MNLSEQKCPECKQDEGLCIESSRELEVSRIKCSDCGYDFSGECCEEDLIEKFKTHILTKRPS